jgi:hypothetical protein
MKKLFDGTYVKESSYAYMTLLYEISLRILGSKLGSYYVLKLTSYVSYHGVQKVCIALQASYTHSSVRVMFD